MSSIPRGPVVTHAEAGFRLSSLAAPDYANKPVGTRYETVPHEGPGTATYCPQPSRATLVSLPPRPPALATTKLTVDVPLIEQKANNGVFASPTRPFYYRDPEGRDYVDIDGNTVSKRWVLVDPRGGEEESGCICV